MKKNKSLGKAILIIFLTFIVISIIGAISFSGALDQNSVNIAEQAFGVEMSLPFLIILMFLAVVLQFLPFIIFFGFIIFGLSFSKKFVEQNKDVIEKSKENTTVKKVPSIKTSHNIHVSKGSPEDATARKTTGKSLYKDDCEKCEDLEPWDTPKESVFRKFLNRSDNNEDDIEVYYREKGMKPRK